MCKRAAAAAGLSRPCRTVCSPSASATARSPSAYAGIAGRNSAERAADGAAHGAGRAAQGRQGGGAARLRGHARTARDAAARLARPVPRSQAQQRHDAARALRRTGGDSAIRSSAGASTRCSTCRRAPAIGKARSTRSPSRASNGHVEPEVGAAPPRRAAHGGSARRSKSPTRQGARARHRSACSSRRRSCPRQRSPAASSPHAARAARPRASSRKTWKLSPHPDLALVYAFAKPGDSPRERAEARQATGEPRRLATSRGRSPSPSPPSRRMTGRRRARRSRLISMTARRRASAR